MKLWIAEKPAVAKLIASVLGVVKSGDGFINCKNDNVVTWCFGHLIESLSPKEYNSAYESWDISTLPLKLFPIQYKPIHDKENQVKLIGNLLKKADCVVNAGDNDDEGQLLVDELLLYHNYKGQAQRVLISDMTESAVAKAMQNLKDNNDFKGQYLKAYARSSGDQIYGLSMTRALTCLAKKKGYEGSALTLGRVQTPTLALVVNRYFQNKNHESSFYYELIGKFGGVCTGSYIADDSILKDENGRILNNTMLLGILSEIKNCSSAEVVSIEKTTKKEAPPLPYNLAKLQQDMNKKYKFTAQQTLQLTQELREKNKAITYNRSDCAYLSEEQYNESGTLINKIKKLGFGIDVDINPSLKSKAFNNSKITAHTGIIPSGDLVNQNLMTEDHKKVFKAICDMYLVQFMKSKISDTVTVIVNVNNRLFKLSSTKIMQLGFDSLLNKDLKTENKEFDFLNSLSKSHSISSSNFEILNKKTTPPKLFNEASLIGAMTRIADFVEDEKIRKTLKEKDENSSENGSIGTPATRSTIIEALKKSKFIFVEKNNLIPTENAIELIKLLPKVISNPDLTASWFLQQNEIEKGNLTVDKFVDSLYFDIENLISTLSKTELNFKSTITHETIGKCPNCDSSVYLKKQLAICSKECGFTLWRNKNEKLLSKKEMTQLIVDHKTDYLDGFKNKEGKIFTAQLILDGKLGNVKMAFKPQNTNFSSIGSCPSCKNDVILKDKLASCSNNCGFVLWRNISGKSLNDNELKILLTKGKTDYLDGFISKNGNKYSAMLSLDNEHKVKLTFKPFEKKENK